METLTRDERVLPKHKRKLTPYQRIIRAGKRGSGTYLTPGDVWMMSRDEAIVSVAEHDDERDAFRRSQK